MMDKNNRKTTKRLLSLSLFILLSAYIIDEPNYKPKYSLYHNEDETPYSKYTNGDVYIGNHDYIDSIKDEIEPNDVLIEYGFDDHDVCDPNVKIRSSYKIRDKYTRNDILNILLSYDQCHDNEWNRSIESMRLEWAFHNLLYDIGYQRERTKDVDLDNSEEELYDKPIVNKLLKL